MNAGVRRVYPTSRSHPILRDAFAASADASTVWRLRYNLPPTDPRFLEATEEQVLEDLLVQRYHADRIEDMLHPSTAEHGSPTAKADYEAARDALLADAGFQRAIATITGRNAPAAPRPGKITFKRRHRGD